ncbi:craniofacial development protein 2-like [Helicoverpa zea]|uniref:craniofacial development protein 2-like n=1 Tax=Helicoverpa zea TaxID=7113 RepID=UPI001F57C439|nr:craniofacial development protein 2-like [Helicoverpa zea]
MRRYETSSEDADWLDEDEVDCLRNRGRGGYHTGRGQGRRSSTGQQDTGQEDNTRQGMTQDNEEEEIIGDMDTRGRGYGNRRDNWTREQSDANLAGYDHNAFMSNALQDKNLKESVIDVKRVNDRIIVVKIMYESLIINVISVYAPQVGCDDRVKEQFWTDFDAVMMNVPTNEQVFVGGDFNGHVGRMRGNYERVHGGWGFGFQNDEGEALLQAATAFDLAVVNTWFQKNIEHLITYKSGHHVTQIDYFLVRRSSLKNIKDCKVIPSEAVVSQHRPLVMDVILSTRPKAKERRPPKIKWHLLGKRENWPRNLEK